MITLITGGPGTGKTAWLLNELIDLRKKEPNRLIYIHGIRNLRGIQHETIYCKSQLCDLCRSKTLPDDAKLVENWPEWKEPGSLIVVDEVQRIWRPRTGGSIPHESVSMLETHRHYGLDFWLISQGPHLFDNFIRLLVGRHIHLVAKWNGRSQYEWPECKQDVQSRSDAVIRGYTLPKRVYSMYDSAEIHTKQEKRKPLSLYVAIIAALMVVGLSYRIYDRIKEKTLPTTEQAVAGTASAVTDTAQSSIKQEKKSFPDFKPSIPGLAESAPAYSELIKVQQAPMLKGCIKTKTECKCFTNQATPYETSQAFCEEYMKSNVFNPYLTPHQVHEQIEQTNKETNNPQL